MLEEELNFALTIYEMEFKPKHKENAVREMLKSYFPELNLSENELIKLLTSFLLEIENGKNIQLSEENKERLVFLLKKFSNNE